MPIDILMPALSPTMEKGNLTRWLKAIGDVVTAGDVVAEIETDKATMEIEAGADGVLSRIVVPAGSLDIPVNTTIGALATQAEQVTAAADNGADDHRPAERLDGGPAAPASPGEEAEDAGRDGRIFASPIARRLMTEAGLDPAGISGSGPRGRILERDVKAAIEARASAASSPPAPQPAASAQAPSTEPDGIADQDSRIKALFAPDSYSEVRHDPMRLTIARRLSEAKRSVPHFYLSADCSIDALLELRRQLNDAAPKHRDGTPAYRLSVNDFVVRALALALVAVPDANVSFTESAMLKHRHADVSVAVAIEGGLMTPIVRKAETKTLATISNEIKQLAARARDRRLNPEEYQGGTSSVSNLGMYGIRDFAAIVNPPQASILAVGAGQPRPVVSGESISIATMMSVTLSVDHRAIDGSVGADLLAAFRSLIEKPMTMLV